MDIFRAGSKPTKKSSSEWFTGTVWQDPIIEAPEPARVRALKVSFEPGEVFGKVDQDLIFEDDIKNVPEEYRELGKIVEFQNDTGDVKPFRVTEINDSKIVLDGNHPLSNIKINFNVNIINIRNATETEINALNEVTET